MAGNGIEVDDLSFNDESFGIVYCPKLSRRQVSDLSFNGDLVDEPINSSLEPIDEDITDESIVGVVGPEAISNKKKYGFAALLLISLFAIVIGVSVSTRKNNANANVSSLNAPQDKLDYCNKIMTQEMSIIDSLTEDEDDEEGDDESMSRSASNDSLNVMVDVKAVRKYVAVEERVSNESRDVELNFGDRKRVLRGGKDIEKARVREVDEYFVLVYFLIYI